MIDELGRNSLASYSLLWLQLPGSWKFRKSAIAANQVAHRAAVGLPVYGGLYRTWVYPSMQPGAAFGSEVPSATNEASCTDREME